MNNAKLTHKQEKFCQEFLIDRNYTHAYIRAGYAKNNASSASYTLSTKPHVKSRIKELIEKQNKEVQVDAKYVLQRLRDIDQLDIMDIMNEDLTEFKSLRDWPKTWRISINAIDIKKIIETRKGKGDIETVIEKIKWPDKTRNLELLGKHVDVKAFEEGGPVEEAPITNIKIEVVGANNND